MFGTYEKNTMLYVRLYRKSDLLRPIFTSRDSPEFRERGWFDDYPRAIVYGDAVFGDTKEVDRDGFRTYIEDAYIWDAGGPLDH